MKVTDSSRRGFVLATISGSVLTSPQTSRAQSTGKTLNKKQLADLVASAKSAADHQKLAEHYLAVAAKHEMEAKEHTELAAKYKANPTASEAKRPNAPDTAAHCLKYAEHCRMAAKMMNDMAAMHEELAKKAN